MKILFKTILLFCLTIAATSCSSGDLIEETDSLEKRRISPFTVIDPDPINSQTLFPYMRIKDTCTQGYILTARRSALPPNSPELLVEIIIARGRIATVEEVIIPANSRTSIPVDIIPEYEHMNTYGTLFPLSALGEGQASLRIGTVRINGNTVTNDYVLETGSTYLNPDCI